MIGEKCSPEWHLKLFMDHIVISLPNEPNDFRFAYSKAKQEITECVQQHFPERNAELLFEVRNGSWNCSFKLRKNAD